MKERSPSLRGLVDLHFHGAYGIDLMTSRPADLDKLAERLAKDGVAAFCPTTLSLPRRELLAAVERLGPWIRKAERDPALACPLGIHLEGPFISPQACGAHPPNAIRAIDWDELEALWRASCERLKILTVAPERLNPGTLTKLVSWCRARKVRLSLGHSRADELTAKNAFRAGFTGVTHAWNALPFHQRSPGVLGAAIGRPGVYLEIIPDGFHVAPSVVTWTYQLHREHGAVCFVSDCVPAGATSDERTYPFGPLKIQRKAGVCRLPNGALAGGGDPLAQTYRAWVKREAESLNQSVTAVIRESFAFVSTDPLRALGISPRRLAGRRIQWRF